VHETVEKMLLKKIIKPYEHFHHVFTEQLKKIGITEDSQLASEMRKQVDGIFELVVPSLDEYFAKKGGWSLVATEEALMESITESRVSGYSFKGFIDLVLKDGQGHYHVIDWKTCSWGWNARKKADILYARQLVLYKHYYSKKLGLNPRAVSTHFGLLKRTAKKNRIELFRVTSGERKTKNSLDFLDKALYNIINKRYIKNRLSCKYCPFHETEHCS
jgi:ATP-dependent exoDNAse (exonuclease V) beta subunit